MNQNKWKYGLCESWCQKPEVFCRSSLCTPWTFARARSKYDGSEVCFNFCCVSNWITRNIIRNGYKIKGGCCGDCMFTSCCPVCSSAQTYLEVEERGPISQKMK